MFDIPDYGMHAALLATGRVLLYGYPRLNRNGTGPNNHGEAWVWDPARGTGHDAFTDVPPPGVAIAGVDRPAPIVCSGLGVPAQRRPSRHRGQPGSGDHQRNQHDPDVRSLQRALAPPGRHGPRSLVPGLQVLTSDGRVVILGGQDENGNNALNPELEVWPAPGIPVLRYLAAEGVPPAHMASADRLTAMYPHLFTMRDGRVPRSSGRRSRTPGCSIPRHGRGARCRSFPAQSSGSAATRSRSPEVPMGRSASSWSAATTAGRRDRSMRRQRRRRRSSPTPASGRRRRRSPSGASTATRCSCPMRQWSPSAAGRASRRARTTSIGPTAMTSS